MWTRKRGFGNDFKPGNGDADNQRLCTVPAVQKDPEQCSRDHEQPGSSPEGQSTGVQGAGHHERPGDAPEVIGRKVNIRTSSSDMGGRD